jgi:hypothetical protein
MLGMNRLRHVSPTMRLAVAALALALSGPVMALDLKGIEIDKPLDCERIKAGGTVLGGPCSARADSGPTIWMTTLVGTKAGISIVVDPSTHDVEFAGSTSRFEFADVRSALTAKFGEPKCAETPVTNGYGAKFVRTVCRWEDATTALMLATNMHKLGDTSLVLASRRAEEAKVQAHDKAASDI